MKIWQKTISVIATFALLFNSLVAPLSVLAQEATPEPTPEATTQPIDSPTPEATIEATATPEATPDATPTEIAIPTPASTSLTASPEAQPTDQPVETQAPESNPTTTSPPASTEPTSTPTATPEVPTETGTLSATILENTTVDTSALNAFDLSYQTDGSAVIVTDKLDYSPYDTAIITGSGFIAGKTYQLTVSSTDPEPTSTTVNVTASETGTIMYAYELDHTYRPNYSVVVKDLERVVAETTFTDSKPKTLTLGSQVGTATSGIGSSSTYSLSLSFQGNPSSCTANISVSGLTTGITVDASSPTSFVSTGTTSGTLKLNVSSAVVAGSYSFTVTATPLSGCDSGASIKSENGSLVVSAAPSIKTDPTLSVTNSPVTYNGSAQSATVTAGSVAGVVSNIRYNGLTTIPTNANTYAITADFAPTDTTLYNSLTSASADNFIINQASSTTTVTCPANVTYNGIAQTPCSTTITGAGGLNLTQTPAYSNNINAGTATASYAYLGDPNHSGSSDSKNFTIDKANQTISVTTHAPTSAANGTGFTVAATGGGSGNPVIYKSLSLDVCTNSGGTFTMTSGSGTCTVQFNQAGNSNYADATSVEEFTSATRASTTTTIVNATNLNTIPSERGVSYAVEVNVTRSAGTQTPTGNVTLTDGTDSYTNTVVGSSGTSSYIFSFISTTAGLKTLTATYNGDSNFNTSSTSTTHTVNKSTPNITWANPSDITYGTVLNSAQLNATASVPGAFTYNPILGTKLNAGLSQTLSVNFVPTDSVNYSNTSRNTYINVNKKILTVTANNQTINFGDPDPAFTFSYSGFVATDNSSIIDTPPNCSVTGLHSNVGTYSIICSGGVDNNYDFSYVSGTLTILDVTAPITSSDAEVYTFGDWTKNNVNVTFTCLDSGSGCNKTYYCYNIGTTPSCVPTTQYVSTITFDSAGQWYLRYFSNDKAGNAETIKVQEIKIDQTAPTGVWVNPLFDNTVSGTVPLQFNATDSGSGVKSVAFEYSTDGWVNHTDIADGVLSGSDYVANWNTTALDLGDYALRAIVTDNANNSAEKDITVGVSAIISSEDGFGNTHTTAIITWTTDRPTKSRVVYDTVQHPTLDLADPNLGYAYSTGTYNTDPKVLKHEVTLDGLSTGTIYYYRTISEGSPAAFSNEHSIATLTNAGPPSTGGNGESVLGASTTNPLAIGHALAYSGNGTGEEADNVLGIETAEVASPEVSAAQTETEKVNLIKWILTHKKISLGVVVILITVAYLLSRRKRA
jgi:hypothetical protein